jgi:3',5'-cyclic AMP phosphodiesterase CpdA
VVVVGADSAPANGEPTSYVAKIEVVRDDDAPARELVEGVVFDDTSRDGRSQFNEAGVPGVMVTNGRDVVVTGEDGRYVLPAYEGMTVSVTKPAGWQTPVNEDNFPQFYYHHLPEGSPPLQFRGLPPTGPLPVEINFPLAKSQDPDELRCAVIGDTQTYSNRELGYLRDGVVKDLAERDDLGHCGALIVGDVAGDDLGLYPRIREVMSLADVPVRAVPGNHDIDYDAETDEHSFDTYKRHIGPAYYSYDVGEVHFVGLDNVRYPCTPEVDNADGKHEFCNDPANHPDYNGVLGEEQLTWLANDLEHVPEDKLVVIATHIPLVTFIDQYSTKHQTDDVTQLYALLEGRPALSVAGHAQLVENMETGDSFEGWKDAVGVEALPFPHITAGAASGSWYTGDLDSDGLPEAIQRGGAPPGYMDLRLDGNTFQSTYRATLQHEDEQMKVSISSPRFRSWYEEIAAWQLEQEAQEEQDWSNPPPLNINDLGDPNLLTPQDLTGGDSSLVANVWNGSTSTEVQVRIDNGAWQSATRTQQARGEGMLEGAEYGDPWALMRQLEVGRYALQSTSGEARAQGWEAFRGDKFGPGPAQPIPSWLWADQSPHLWKAALPADLEQGGHTATVRATDPYGRVFEEILNFEVAEERPPMHFRKWTFPAEEQR